MRINRLQRLGVLVVPGAVFQTIVTGGGFATGREISEYFVRHGSAAWWASIIVAVVFGLLIFLTAETSRMWRAFDYRTWATRLLGRWWYALDVLFVLMSVLVCAIVISGATVIFATVVRLPAAVGAIGGILAVLLVSASGRRVVVFAKILGCLILTSGYFLFAISTSFGGSDVFAFGMGDATPLALWARSALEYVGYNAVALPACLYAFSGLESRRGSVIASVIAVFLLMLPVICVATTIVGHAGSAVPLHDALKGNAGGLLVLYYIILIWTLLDTGVGLVFALIGRVNSALAMADRPPLGALGRILGVGAFLSSAVFLSQVGIVDLVAKGYGAIAYGFFALLVIPLVWVGVRTLRGRT